jgi:NAD(P)H dehydrogenase (quinone)
VRREALLADAKLMKVLHRFSAIILAHPDLPGEYFNHAIAGTAGTAADTLRRNLAIKSSFTTSARNNSRRCSPRRNSGRTPSSIRSCARHCKEIANADGIIIVHPNWWGMPPAILKGWIDRVLRPEVAYRFVEGDKGEGVPMGLLKAKAAIIFNTANTPAEREREIFGDPLETLWKNCVFDLCGVRKVHRQTFAVVVTSTPQQRAAWLAEVRRWWNDSFPSAGDATITPFQTINTKTR